MGGFALADIPGDVSQLEELPARMRPAQRAGHRSCITVGVVETIVSAIGIRLQHTLPPGQMLIGIGCRAITGELEERGRWRATIPGPIIAHVGPEPGLFRTTPRQKRHGRVVAMQQMSGKHVGLDQGMDRLQGNSRLPDQVYQGRQAQLDAFTGEALSLPVQPMNTWVPALCVTRETPLARVCKRSIADVFRNCKEPEKGKPVCRA